MFFGADEQSAQRHRWSGMTKLIERISVQNVEFVAPFHDCEFPGSRDAEQAALDPNRRTEVVPAHPFLVTDLAGGGIHARDNSTVAPEPGAIIDNQTRRHI